MTSQNRKDIINGLVTLLIAEVSGFALVTDEAKHREELGPDDFPTAKVKEGPSRSGGAVTLIEQMFMLVAVKILCDVDSDDDDLRDLAEAVIDAVNTDLTLGDTCVMCLFNSVGEPQFWPGSSYKTVDVFFEVQYWRDL